MTTPVTAPVTISTPPAVPPRRRPPHPLLKALIVAFRFVCGVLIIFDELLGPLYRPLVQRIAALQWMRAFERWVARRSPYLVLALIAVPYVVVEPLKVLALLAVARGAVKSGTLAFLFANLVSFLLIERIFSAGRAQLMQLRPVAYVIETIATVHRAIVTALRLDELKRRARALWRWVRMRLR